VPSIVLSSHVSYKRSTVVVEGGDSSGIRMARTVALLSKYKNGGSRIAYQGTLSRKYHQYRHVSSAIVESSTLRDHRQPSFSHTASIKASIPKEQDGIC
jgi:hypothetical protein